MGTVINVQGTVTTSGTGANAIAIRSEGDGAVITISGTVSATASADAIAIDIKGRSQGGRAGDRRARLTPHRNRGDYRKDYDSPHMSVLTDNRLIKALISSATSAQTVNANQHLTIPTALSVTISSGNSPAITLQGASAQLTNQGTISTSSTAHAVLISANDGTITNSGTISTSSLAHAISITANNATINNSSTIETTRANAPAIYSTNSAMGVTINHLTGTITTQGAGANAIYPTKRGEWCCESAAPPFRQQAQTPMPLTWLIQTSLT